MKQQPLLLSILGAATLLSLTGYAQKNQDAKTLEERVQGLEQELAGLRESFGGLTESSEKAASQMDGISVYLQSQAKSAKQMQGTLAQAEKLGFIPGINFSSRETLLSGWRAQLQTQQQGVPGATPVKESEPTRGRRSSRQRR
ncbi:MAG: type II secretory pathway pseudopilin PulG [Candidatus Paceibacteria bacterium]|jgi:type II secretory pathway pseudopilin PulG